MRLTNWLAPLLLASPAFAADWYVDAVNGNNSNSGISPAAAWKTITWAVAHVPTSGIQDIHLAPGLYNAALGETFPIVMRPDLRILGDQGPATSVVEGSGTGSLFSLTSFSSGPGWGFGESTRIVGLTLRSAAQGVLIQTGWNAVSPQLVDLEIEQMSNAGVYISAGSYPCCGSSSARLERVRVRSCARGLRFDSASGTSRPTLLDCDFSANSGPGVLVLCGGTLILTMDHCRIEGNGADGLQVDAINYGWAQGTLSDCSISGNAGHGWRAPIHTALGAARHAVFTRCTVAGNAIGISAYHDGSGVYDAIDVRDSIIHGNGDDLAITVSSSSYVPFFQGCEIGDGDFAGVNSNFSADPLFVNAAAGDWRLQFGSPCTDVATEVPAADTLDALGHTRDVDGDLDTVELADIGAFEHRPLELVGTAQLGTLVKWELWGPQGATTTVYWTRVAIAGAPTATPFGELDLVPSKAHVYRVATAGSSAANVLQRSIPNAISLVGLTFAFQSLVDSAAAPNGKAYSNAVQFTVLP